MPATALFKPNFVAALPVATSDPVQSRRNALLVRLADQKALANDPSHMRSFRVRKKDSSGNTIFETQKANIRPAWKDGVFFLRIGGGKLLELAKGQPGIAVKSKDELVQAIDWVTSQVTAGSFDKQLEDAAAKSRARLQKSKKTKAA